MTDHNLEWPIKDYAKEDIATRFFLTDEGFDRINIATRIGMAVMRMADDANLATEFYVSALTKFYGWPANQVKATITDLHQLAQEIIERQQADLEFIHMPAEPGFGSDDFEIIAHTDAGLKWLADNTGAGSDIDPDDDVPAATAWVEDAAEFKRLFSEAKAAGLNAVPDRAAGKVLA